MKRIPAVNNEVVPDGLDESVREALDTNFTFNFPSQEEESSEEEEDTEDDTEKLDVGECRLIT